MPRGIVTETWMHPRTPVEFACQWRAEVSAAQRLGRRAGARYLYICEDGLVHYCSQQRGYPGVPLESYTTSDIRREFSTPKSCAPYCTVGCVHRVSTMDFWRSPQDVGVGHGSVVPQSHD